MKKVTRIVAVVALIIGAYTLNSTDQNLELNFVNALATDGEDAPKDDRGNDLAFTDGEDAPKDDRGNA